MKEEQPLQELSLPPDAQTRLCLFAVPVSLLSFYRERVFPIVRDAGFVPLTADDVVSPGDTFLPKIDALIERALLFVVDASSQSTLAELGLAARKVDASRILIVAQRMSNLPSDLQGVVTVTRPDVKLADPEDFLAEVRNWFFATAKRLKPGLEAEPRRLLLAREYRAAVTAAITLLESTLRQRLDLHGVPSSRPTSLRTLLDLAKTQGLLGNVTAELVFGWLRIRNEVVHSQRPVTKAAAEQIVNGVMEIIQANAGLRPA